jgi:hypothetical protein
MTSNAVSAAMMRGPTVLQGAGDLFRIACQPWWATCCHAAKNASNPDARREGWRHTATGPVAEPAIAAPRVEGRARTDDSKVRGANGVPRPTRGSNPLRSAASSTGHARGMRDLTGWSTPSPAIATCRRRASALSTRRQVPRRKPRCSHARRKPPSPAAHRSTTPRRRCTPR